MSITSWTATRLNQALQEKQVSPQEVWQAYQDRIAKGQETFNIYNHVVQEPALGSSAPIALKDNLCTRAVPTTCSSRILQGFVPPYDATVVQRLQQAGVMSLGKTNLDEFAMGSSNENSARGPVCNPWDPARVPGGSSGGSAAAVAAQMAPWALGSDTGGSVRLPAAFCGVVGLKPTYGLVSRYGLVAFASSLDQIGPLTRDVRDSAELLNLIAGPDPLDSTSLPHPRPDYTAGLAKPVAGLTLGVPREMMAEGVQADVKRAVEAAIRTYEALGAKVEFTTLPHTAYALAIYYLIATAEASSNLARYDGIRYGYRTEAAKDLDSLYTRTRSEGFGWEVKRRIMLGTYALSAGYYDAYYKKAQQGRTLILRDFEAAFSRYDLLLSPTAPVTAFPIGEKVHDPMQLYLVDICTVMANLAGIPAISLPCGFDQNGLPIGLQLMGPALSEARVLQAAFAFEQATDFRRLPNLN